MQKIKSFIRDNREAAASAALLLLFTLLSAFLPSGAVFPVLAVLFLLYAGFFVYRFTAKYKYMPSSSGDALSTLTVDILTTLPVPVMLVAEDDSVTWYNKAFAEIKELSGLKYGESVKNCFGGALTYSALKRAKSEFEFETDGKPYTLYTAEVSSHGKRYFLTVWNDRTALQSARELLNMRNVVVGYAAIDNAAEVSSYLQEQYRTAVAKSFAELYNWVGDMHGIVREFERDKYIIFVDEESFTPNMAKKFDILDRVNTPAAGESSKLTMSMSFAVMDGSLAEKEKAANEALNYAFQRGGAQVIVKTKDGNLSFGGQNRAVEKTTKIKSRVTAGRLRELISGSGNVLIMGHKSVDFDAIAAACGAARLAMTLEKPVNIIVNPEDAALRTVLPLIGDLPEYEHIFVDRARGQELLSPDTLLVIVDVNNPQIFESSDIYENAQSVAIIDHHVQTSEFDVQPKLQYIDPTASSASELMCEILEQAIPRSALKTSEAELLLTGILLDTQRFTRNTGVRTFGAAIYLRPDAKMLKTAQSVFKPDIQNYTKQAVFRKNAIIFRDVIAISYYEDDALAENRIMASISAESMLSIASVKASFALCTIGADIHISARSDGTINVSKIAETLGGGGRFEAAAVVMPATDMRTAMTELRKAIDAYWEENNTTGGTAQ